MLRHLPVLTGGFGLMMTDPVGSDGHVPPAQRSTPSISVPGHWRAVMSVPAGNP